MTIYTNSGLTISMQSAIASSTTIASISQADPGEIGTVAHGYSDGDIILIECLGMTELDGRLFVVNNKGNDTYELEDVDGTTSIDTTNFGAFVSGTAKAVTLGTTITGVQDFSASGGDANFVDTTSVADLNGKQTIVGSSPMSYSLTMQWDPEDAGQLAMIQAYELLADRGFKIQWPSGMYTMFNGTIGYSGAPGGGNQSVTTSPAAIAMTGTPTYGQ